MIIGISGKIGSGKNYIAENLIGKKLEEKEYIPIYLAFADQIKVEFYSRNKLLNLNYDNLFVNKTKEIRKELQIYGTDIGRSQKDTVWIDALDMWIQIFLNRWTMKMKPVFIITDVRFENEAEYIKNKNGLLVRIEASKRNEQKLLQESNGDIEILNSIKNHKSETSLDNYNGFDLVINNDYVSIEEIENEIKKLI